MDETEEANPFDQIAEAFATNKEPSPAVAAAALREGIQLFVSMANSLARIADVLEQAPPLKLQSAADLAEAVEGD